jgi:hypothetical protein
MKQYTDETSFFVRRKIQAAVTTLKSERALSDEFAIKAYCVMITYLLPYRFSLINEDWKALN